MIPYNILASGSQGNATVLDGRILIDCGVPFRTLQPHVSGLRIVLLTHIHSDHFQRSTIRRLARERPTLRFGCCDWLVEPLVRAGVDKRQIDVYHFDTAYDYGRVKLIPVFLPHNVPNCGYKLHFAAGGKVIYCTDCNNLNGISAYHYDLFLVEANHDEAEINERIREKEANGEYAYERRAKMNHLSKQKCDAFIYRNASPNSRYVYMHCHEDLSKPQEEQHGQKINP